MKTYLELFVILITLISFWANNLFSKEYATDPNTVSLWHFNETSGSTVYDASGNNNNGTVWQYSSIVEGKFGNGRLLSGSSGAILVPNSPSLTVADSFLSVEGWIFMESREAPYGQPKILELENSFLLG